MTSPASRFDASHEDSAAEESPLTIIGAGPAGLASGWYARRAGRECRLYEAADEVGGNTRTLSMGPFRYDTGAHRFHDKIPEVTEEVKGLLGEELRRIDVPSQIYWRGRWIDFPLAPFDLAAKLPWSVLARAVGENLAVRALPSEEPGSFREMALGRYGRTLAREFLINYTEKLWGRPCEELVPEVAGGRLEGLDLRTFLLELVGGRRRRVRHLDGSFYYPKSGYGAIAEAIAEEIGRERISCGTPVTAIRHDEGRVREIVLDGERVRPVEEVISTLPCTLAVRLMEPAAPEPVRAAADRIDFRHLRLVVLALDRPQFTENASVYFPDPAFPFTRIYEPKNRSSDLAPPGKTALVVEVPVSREDQIWKLEDDTLRDRVVGQLADEELIDPGQVGRHECRRVPFAYPVLDLAYRDRLDRISGFLDGFDNLELVGRGAEFRYRHTHELLQDARSTIEHLLPRR